MFYNRSFLGLSCVLSVALMLAACGDTRKFIHEKYTGERYGDPVAGPRRQPALNSEFVAGEQKLAAPPEMVVTKSESAAVAEEKTIVAETTVAKAANGSKNPYDNYDENGRDVSRVNYFEKWFGGGSAEEEGQKNSAQSGDNFPPRKKFRGFDAASQESAAHDFSAMKEQKIIVDKSVDKSADKSVIKTKPDLDENGVYVPLTDLQPGGNGAFAADKRDYPHLATVPKVPPNIAAIRREKDDNLRQLQLNHDAAVEQKESLLNEPTELSNVSLSQVDNMIKDIDGALRGDVPIVESAR